ncbi:MAG TPA: ABC-2 family transporter protein [Candidatus Saccharimonadales bacterium]|nr:ABC-2 family transporter protein [Candidatus Saccharimonadales bacterium]
MGRFKHVPAYWKVLVMSAREDRANPTRIAGSIALGVIRMILLAAIYKVAYEAVTGDAPGLPYANALWSIGLYFALIIGLGMRNVFKLVDREVKSGAVEVALIKPLDWRLTKVCVQLGKNLLETGLLMAAFVITLLIVVGAPDLGFITPAFVIGYLLIIVLAIVASSALFLAVGLTAFWLNDAQPTFRLVDKIILIFGGAFVPIALLPQAVQDAVRYSPFGVYAASTQLFNPGMARYLFPTIVSSLFWTVMTVLFCNWVWRRAEQRIEVNGG